VSKILNEEEESSTILAWVGSRLTPDAPDLAIRMEIPERLN